MKNSVQNLPDVFAGRLTVSINEAALALGISAVSVRRLIKRGHLRPLRHLRHLRIPVTQIKTLVEDCPSPTSIPAAPMAGKAGEGSADLLGGSE